MFEPNVLVSDLKLGDIIKLGPGEFMTATVHTSHPNGDKGVWRPYIHTDDVQYGAGAGASRVIPYMGLEDFTLMATTKVERLRKGKPTR